jgi:hypothetical protein
MKRQLSGSAAVPDRRKHKRVEYDAGGNPVASHQENGFSMYFRPE